MHIKQIGDKVEIGDYWQDSDGDIMQVCADGRSYCIIRDEAISRIENTIRRGLAVQFAPDAPDGVSVCGCGNEAEYTGGECRDCHESAIDYAMTTYEASWRGQ